MKDRPSYPEVGATRGTLPDGYTHREERRQVGEGRDAYEGAVEKLLTWEVHRRAGLEVTGAERAAPGAEVTLSLRRGRWRVRARCQVVYVVAEPDRRGFAYGTMVGHPERREELFLVTIDESGRVHLEIRAFSRPAAWWARLCGPVTRRVQDQVTGRYLRALVEDG